MLNTCTQDFDKTKQMKYLKQSKKSKELTIHAV